MKTRNYIPKINTIASILIIAFILNVLFSSLETPYLTALFAAGEFSMYTFNVQVATIVHTIFKYLVNIIIAIWIFKESKRQNERPWTWTLFALLFGLIAVVTFY